MEVNLKYNYLLLVWILKKEVIMKSKFERYEIKYLITVDQQRELKEVFKEYMENDVFANYTIYNLYYDTPDYLLIRRSMEKPVYKEKLRIRSYGRVKQDGEVFVELKKKYKSVVYKRRITMTEEESRNYFHKKESSTNTQIEREIDYFKKFYPDIAPKVMIAYDREAYAGKEDPDFRATFDKDILYRETELTLTGEKYGTPILDEDMVLLEVKVAGGFPLWLTKFFTENHIYKISFSKYARAYEGLMKTKEKGKEETSYAV